MNGHFASDHNRRLKKLLLSTVFLIGSVAPLCAQPSSFGGVVVGLEGKTMAGVAVRAKPEGTNPAGLTTFATQTDASGRYRFEGVPSGNYLVTAGAEDGKATTLRALLVTSMESVFYQTLNGASVASRVRLSPLLRGPSRITLPDAATHDFDLILLPSVVSVSGRLDIPSGATFPAMRVRLTRTETQNAAELDRQANAALPPSPVAPTPIILRISPESEFMVDANVQPDGTFQLTPIPPGTYVLRLNPNLGIPPVTIKVADADVTGITLGGKSVGVRVSGYAARSDQSPYKDLFPEWVYLIGRDATEIQTPATSTIPARAYVDAAGIEIEAPITPVQSGGYFEFLAVPAGEYFLRAIPDPGIPDARISIRGDKDIDDVRIGNGTRVRGQVVATNSGTRPPETIALIATRPRGQSVNALVDPNGSFEFPKVGAGTYRVLLDGTVRPTPAEVSIGDDDAILRVETPFKAWVPGRVTFDGPGPPSESLEVTRVALTNGYGAEIKPDGSFQIKSEEGEFEFSMLSVPEGYVVKSVVSGGANLLMEPVKVDLRIPTPEIVVTLQYKPEATQ
jgi:hypothetical protein